MKLFQPVRTCLHSYNKKNYSMKSLAGQYFNDSTNQCQFMCWFQICCLKNEVHVVITHYLLQYYHLVFGRKFGFLSFNVDYDFSFTLTLDIGDHLMMKCGQCGYHGGRWSMFCLNTQLLASSLLSPLYLQIVFQSILPVLSLCQMHKFSQ